MYLPYHMTLEMQGGVFMKKHLITQTGRDVHPDPCLLGASRHCFWLGHFEDPMKSQEFQNRLHTGLNIAKDNLGIVARELSVDAQ